jgi:hypothetical protein
MSCITAIIANAVAIQSAIPANINFMSILVSYQSSAAPFTSTIGKPFGKILLANGTQPSSDRDCPHAAVAEVRRCRIRTAMNHCVGNLDAGWKTVRKDPPRLSLCDWKKGSGLVTIFGIDLKCKGQLTIEAMRKFCPLCRAVRSDDQSERAKYFVA